MSLRVLVVLYHAPLVDGCASSRYAIALLRGLRENGVAVRALAGRHEQSRPGTPPADLPVEVVPVEAEPPGLRRAYRRAYRPRGELSTAAFTSRLRELAGSADVLHLEETRTALCGVGLDLPAAVHVHYLVRADRRPGLRPGGRPPAEFLEYALSERRTLRRYRHLVATSPLVASELATRAPAADVTAVPPALDPADYARAPLDGPPTAGIIGLGDWPPTRDAIVRLVREVWPQVRRRVPEARLLVAGWRTERYGWIEALPGVELVGEVPSASAFLGRLSVLLYPPRRGSGMKVKVLEALACGVPVVTTGVGAEGVAPCDGVVVESESRRLAEAAARLLRDAGERRERGEAGREAILHHHAPGPATRPLADLYERLAGT